MTQLLIEDPKPMIRKFQRSIVPFAIGLSMACASLPAFSHGDEPHGDHDAHHGGFVMMYEDIHFEVAAVPTGGIQIYYTNAIRAELPAATVSDVAVEIVRPGSDTEYVAMGISAAGDFWEGDSAPVAEDGAIVRVGFLYEGQPLMLDVPATALIQTPASTTAADAGNHAGH
jgi:hypothetical protein